MGLCSTAGRLGAMFAPLAPLLVSINCTQSESADVEQSFFFSLECQSQYLDILPYLMFGGMAFIAGVLILHLPETLDRKLPDTLDEAEQINGSVVEMKVR